MYQTAATQHAAGLAEYEGLVNTAHLSRQNYLATGVFRNGFRDEAALNAFADVSADDIRRARNNLASQIALPQYARLGNLFEFQ